MIEWIQLCIIRKHINHTSWNKYDNSNTSHNFCPLFQGSGVFSRTHCKGVSKQLCVYHLYRNVFLAQTRIRSHLGCICSLETRFNTHNQIAIRNAFRNAFLELLRLSSISQYREYESRGLRSCIAQFHPKHNTFKGVSKQLCVYHLYRSVFLAQTRIRALLHKTLKSNPSQKNQT